MDGPLLLRIDEGFARENLGILHALLRRKLVRAVEHLRKAQVNAIKVNPMRRPVTLCGVVCVSLTFAICFVEIKGENIR